MEVLASTNWACYLRISLSESQWCYLHSTLSVEPQKWPWVSNRLYNLFSKYIQQTMMMIYKSKVGGISYKWAGCCLFWPSHSAGGWMITTKSHSILTYWNFSSKEHILSSASLVCLGAWEDFSLVTVIRHVQLCELLSHNLLRGTYNTGHLDSELWGLYGS